MSADEEARAAAYRASATNREKAEAARDRALSGQPSLRRQLGQGWSALTTAIAEARDGESPTGAQLREEREGPTA